MTSTKSWPIRMKSFCNILTNPSPKQICFSKNNLEKLWFLYFPFYSHSLLYIKVLFAFRERGICPIKKCMKTFRQKTSILGHVLGGHYGCLKERILRGTVNKAGRYACFCCELTFASSNSLARHMVNW